MTEARLQASIVKALKSEYGVLAYKWTSPGHAGVPDLICIGPQGTCFMEVKSPKGTGKTSALQLYQHRQITNHGGTVYVVDSLSAARQAALAFGFNPTSA